MESALGAGVPLNIGFFTEPGGSTGAFGSGFLPGGLAPIGLVGWRSGCR